MVRNTYKVYLGKKDATAYTKLLDIKEFPDLGGEPELLETTTLSDPSQTYILGIQSIDAMTFTANYTLVDYDKVKALVGVETQFAVFMGGTVGANDSLGTTATDGVFEFKGYIDAYINGGGVNEVVEMTITIAPTTPITKLGVTASK